MITADKEPSQSEISKAFASLQSHYENRIEFTMLDSNSEEGKRAAARTNLKHLPISVLVDSNGRMVEQFEGQKSSKEISKKLNTLLEK